MRTMKNHKFYDDDIVAVDVDYTSETLELSFAFSGDDAILLSKDDIVAMAKVLGLVVFDSSMAL